MTSSTSTSSSASYYSVTDLKDLISFLLTDQLHVRTVASQAMLDLSGGDLIDQLTSTQPTATTTTTTSTTTLSPSSILHSLINTLIQLCEDPSGVIASNALRSLVNLSTHDVLHMEFVNQKFIQVILKFILSPTSELADPACMLLSNLTRHLPIAQLLLGLPRQPLVQTSMPQLSTYALHQFQKIKESRSACHQLVEVFGSVLVNSESTRGYNVYADYHALASVFANMSRVKSSLFFFLDLPLTTPFSATLLPNDVLPATCPLLQLLPFLDHANRSISIIYLLKNLVYHQTFLDYFLKPLILPVLHRLTPLSFWDSDEFMDHLVYEWTPHFETNGQHQLELLEVVVISTATKVGRNMLRELGGYQVLRTYHTQCQEPLALRWVEMAVDHLMREEANEELEFVEGEGENN